MAVPRLCSVQSCGKPLADISRSPQLDWLRDHIHHRGDECLIWPFKRNWKGYAVVKFRGAKRNAQRAMCILAHGEPPTAIHQAAHSCGNGMRGCVNPRHIRWATPLENAADRVAHGTYPRGSETHSAKLNVDAVRTIRRLAGAVSTRDLASRFNVSPAAIRLIVRRVNWAWVE